MANLHTVYEKLVHARVPEDVYSTLEGSTRHEQLRSLKKLHHYLIKIVHPDKCSDPKDEYVANEATSLLMNLYNEASRRIESGIYGTTTSSGPASSASSSSAFSSSGPIYQFEMRGNQYVITSKLDASDICNVFAGDCKYADGRIESVVYKIPFDSANNDLMKNEAKVLKKVSHKSSTILVDSCKLETGSMVNIFKRVEDAYNFEQIRQKYKYGLPHEHLVWVMDRLLSVLGYFHLNGVIHAGIKPKNLLIVPYNHNGLLSDFSLSIMDATESGKRYTGKNSYTAPEITGDSLPHPRSDLYSLGKSIIYLAGGELDGRHIDLPDSVDIGIRQFLQHLIETDPNERASDAWEEWHKLKDLRVEIFGAENQFLPLDM